MKGTSITVVGNLITPVNRRNLGEGRSVARFRIACNERRMDRATGEWGDGDTFYIGVSCWRDLAENVAALFGIGDPIIVRGRIYTSTYDSKDGRRSVQEIDADAVGPDLSRCQVSRLIRIKRGTGPVATDGAAPLGGAEAQVPDPDDMASDLGDGHRSMYGDEDFTDPRFAAPADVTGLIELPVAADGELSEQGGRRATVPVGGH